jgi:GTPase Era involved in 16S rRNA processing
LHKNLNTGKRQPGIHKKIQRISLIDTAIPIREKLLLILNYLDQGELYAAGAEKQAVLRTRASEILKALDQMERTHLTVGLLGGTGAGKSTIINALADEEISSPSHRRPHTDRVVIYRHKLAPSHDLSLHGIPFEEIIHSRDSIRHILLCDLPDFDSLDERHKAAVSSFLPELDIVVWITTPEKYADARFYRFIEKASRSSENFLFILNKIDLLFENVDSAEGYEHLSKLAAGLTANLSGVGIKGAALYPVSALEALREEFSPWNQFMAFRNLLFKHRDAKSVEAIKTSNIEAEATALTAALQEEARVMKASVSAVLKISDELKSGSPAACNPPGVLSSRALSSEVHRRLTAGNHDHNHLIGPGYLVWLAARYIKGILRSSEHEPPLPEAEETLAAFRRCMEWSRNRLDREMIKENIPEGLRKRFIAILAEDNRVKRFRDRIKEITSAAVQTVQQPSYKFFRVRQNLCYGLITILLLIVLGGESAWSRLVSDPGIAALFELLLIFTNTLFSVEGLAALASYALINIFFGFRFFNQYQKLLNRSAKEAVNELESALLSCWNAALQEVTIDLKEGTERLISSIPDFYSETPLENP